jgi:hypothetical protein
LNIDIVNIGHYRVTSHGGRAYDMFNRESDVVYSLTAEQYKHIKEHMSVAACMFVEDMKSI